MSELTPCNFCSLRAIRAKYKGNGTRVHVRRSPTAQFPNGKNIYAVPQGGAIDTETDVHFVAWFAEIGERCEC